MKIAIRFGDNDFHGTFRNLLQTILNAYEYNERVPTKEQMLVLINKLAYGHYLLFQNQFEYNDEANMEESHTKEYLEIPMSKLLYNEEVDEYLKENYDDNSETFILDTTLYSNQIYSI